MRFFCAEELAPVLNHRQIVQINHSRTLHCGAVRGLHYQHAPHAEMKLVRCVRGAVFDVAVDIRAGSPSRLQYFAQELRANDGKMFVIPEGFAHGFQALEDHCELLYLHTAAYCRSSESGLRHDDPAIGLKWPLDVVELSDRDRSHAYITEEFIGLAL